MTKQEIKQAWKNRKLIIQGVWNTIFRTKYVENIANERKAICDACPFIDLIGDKCFLNGTQPCCGKCGCSLKFKLNSLSSECGDQENPRWKAVMTEKQEESYRKKNGNS